MTRKEVLPGRLGPHGGYLGGSLHAGSTCHSWIWEEGEAAGLKAGDAWVSTESLPGEAKPPPRDPCSCPAQAHAVAVCRPLSG